ncbi:MAG: hypothetical protein LBK01_06395 [Burkholderiaceae bacterium]|nr:hypothetical protein [Burkholderiaceae bacterium]
MSTLKTHKIAVLLSLGTLLLMTVAAWKNVLFPLKLYPVLVNVGMLLFFGLSLVYPPTVIERIARIKEPHLSEPVIRYTRRVTQVWCVFFTLNGTVSLLTVLFAGDKVWALYNGCIAYIMIGLLFAVEYLFRWRLKRVHHA